MYILVFIYTVICVCVWVGWFSLHFELELASEHTACHMRLSEPHPFPRFLEDIGGVPLDCLKIYREPMVFPMKYRSSCIFSLNQSNPFFPNGIYSASQDMSFSSNVKTLCYFCSGRLWGCLLKEICVANVADCDCDVPSNFHHGHEDRKPPKKNCPGCPDWVNDSHRFRWKLNTQGLPMEDFAEHGTGE